MLLFRAISIHLFLSAKSFPSIRELDLQAAFDHSQNAGIAGAAARKRKRRLPCYNYSLMTRLPYIS